MVTFGLFLTSNRGPILLSIKPIPKTRVQLTPWTRSSIPYTHRTPFCSLRTRSRARRFPDNAIATNTNHRYQRLLPTTVAKMGATATTPPTTASPYHHMSFIPMAQPNGAGGWSGIRP